MKKLAHAFVMAIFISGIFGQGLTTSGVNGFIKSTEGEGLTGANIIATHTPSGTQYGTTSMDDGYYAMTNMKIGGPYSISVTYIGYQDQTQSDIYLNLGQDVPR